MGHTGIRDERTIAILRELVENPRISVRRLSSKLGMNYLTVRRKLDVLSRKYGISLGLLLPPDVVGREVAFVRIKLDDREKSPVFVNCTRVVMISRVNGNEVVVVIRGRTKSEISKVIDSIRTQVKGIVEFSVEYGTLELDIPMVVRGLNEYCSNANSNEKGFRNCLDCVINGT